MVYYPEHRIAVAVQINTDDHQDVGAYAVALARSILSNR